MSSGSRRYTDREWAFFEAQIRANRTIEEAREAMTALFGRAPCHQGCWYRIRAYGIPYSGRWFARAYRQAAIAGARSGGYGTLQQLRRSLPVDRHGRLPCIETLRGWLIDAGVSLDRTGYCPGGSNAYSTTIRSRAVDLMRQGYSAASALDILTREGVQRIPSVSTLRLWSQQAGLSRARGGGNVQVVHTRRTGPKDERHTHFLVQDWEADEEKTARLIRRDGCMLAKLRARRQARREAA